LHLQLLQQLMLILEEHFYAIVVLVFADAMALEGEMTAASTTGKTRRAVCTVRCLALCWSLSSRVERIQSLGPHES
jgi:hypothetical protein